MVSSSSLFLCEEHGCRHSKTKERRSEWGPRATHGERITTRWANSRARNPKLQIHMNICVYSAVYIAFSNARQVSVDTDLLAVEESAGLVLHALNACCTYKKRAQLLRRVNEFGADLPCWLQAKCVHPMHREAQPIEKEENSGKDGGERRGEERRPARQGRRWRGGRGEGKGG